MALVSTIKSLSTYGSVSTPELLYVVNGSRSEIGGIIALRFCLERNTFPTSQNNFSCNSKLVAEMCCIADAQMFC